MKHGWKSMDTWVEDPQNFPNELVLLLCKAGNDNRQLYDCAPGEHYVTMGNWYPTIGDTPGHWKYVGWDWCQDHLTESSGDEVIGWQPLPKADVKNESIQWD